MKVGFVGPADGNQDLLREALDFLVSDVEVDQAIYLGIDDTVDRVVERWTLEVAEDPTADAFLARAVEVARRGDASTIEVLLAQRAALGRLGCIRKLPPAPARAIEMIEDRIVTVVHDKGVLDTDDIANSTLVVFGRSEEAMLKSFGPRYFFTPGPLAAGTIGLVEAEAEGQIAVATFAPSGAPLWRRVILSGASTKLTVSK